jgi:hypothetical protein
VLFEHPHRIGDVVAADAGHRGLQRIEGLLADGGHHLGGEAGRLGSLVDHDGPAGVLDGGHDGLDVERDQRPQVQHSRRDAMLVG